MILSTVCVSRGWKSLSASLVGINDEMSFTVTPDGIRTKEIMVGSVALSSTMWDKTKFVKYEYSRQDTLRVAVRVDEFNKILKRFKDDEEINIDLDDTIGMFVIYNKMKSYELQSVTPSQEYEKSLQLGDDIKLVKFETSYQELDSVLKDLEFVGMGVNIQSIGSFVEFSVSEEYSKNKATVRIEKSSIKYDARTVLALEYFKEIISNLGKFSDMIEMSFFEKGFGMLKFHIKEIGIIDYLIAPRIKQEAK